MFVSKPEYDLLADRLHTLAGIELHESKTRVWNRTRECPPAMVVFGYDVWNPRGVKILGTPSNRFGRIRRNQNRGTFGRRKAADRVLGSGPQLRMANFFVMSRSEMPSLSPHTSTNSSEEICPRARRKHDGNNGDSVGKFSRYSRTEEKSPGPGIEIRSPHFCRNKLDIVGQMPFT